MTAFQKKARYYLQAIDAAAKNLRVFIAQKIAEEKVDGTAEGDVTLKRIITNVYTGRDDLSFVDEATVDLKRVIETVEADIKSLKAQQPVKYYIKEAWTGMPKAKDRPKPH